MIFFVLAFCGVILGVCMINFAMFAQNHPGRGEIAVLGVVVTALCSISLWYVSAKNPTLPVWTLLGG